MPKIDKFTQANVRDIQRECATIMANAFRERGITVAVGGGNLGPFSAELKFKFTLAGASAARPALDLKSLGLSSDTFTSGSRTYKIVDYVPSRPAYPITAERQPDGKAFKFSLDMVTAGQDAPRNSGAAFSNDAVGELYRPDPLPEISGGSDKWFAAMKRNMDKLNTIDSMCADNGQVLFRYIEHSYADGAAVYQIVAVNGNRATIQVVTGIGDDWVLPAWGRRKTLALSEVQGYLRQRDGMRAIFSKAKQEANAGA